MEDNFNEEDVLQYFDLIQNGHHEVPVELRALDFKGRNNNTYSGYYIILRSSLRPSVMLQNIQVEFICLSMC